MAARDYELDAAVRNLAEKLRLVDLKYARNRVAAGVTVTPTAPLTGTNLQTVVDELLALSGSGDGGAGSDVTPPLTGALPPWVKPSGSGVITADPQGRLNVSTGTTYRAFPGLTFLEGRLHAIWRTGTAHNSAGGTVDYSYSDDLGRTWSIPATIGTPTGTEDLRDPCITALASGRLLLSYHVATTGGTIAVRVEVIYSDNRGQSWSSPYVIPDTFSGQVAASSPPLELPDGTILQAGYGESGGNYSTCVWSSTDGGLTFGSQTIIATDATRDYYEPQIRHLASGKIVCLMRSNGAGHTWRSQSTDGGATWSAETDVLTAGLGRPDFIEFYPGALFLMIRQASGDDDGYWAVSWDEGLTWTALQETDAGETKDEMYAGMVLLAPGYIVVIYSLEASATDADIYLRYYYDGYGIDTLGNIRGLTVSPSAGITVEDEGTPLATDATTLDFAGAGVTAAGAGAEKTITIPGTPTGAAGGDLSGTYPNPSVVDDSHSHTSATAPGTAGNSFVVDPGSPSYAGSGPTVTLVSVFGITSGGAPYYNAANVTSGEEAALMRDPTTGTYFLRDYNF